MELSGYSSKTLQKGSCPYAPLDEVLRYGNLFFFGHHDSLLIGQYKNLINDKNLSKESNLSCLFNLDI